MVQYLSSHLLFPSSLNLEQLFFNKVDFGTSDFVATVGLQVEAARKMKVATRVLDHIVLSKTTLHDKTLLN